MHWHYTITPAGDFAQVTRRIVEQAAQDPRILRLLHTTRIHSVVFCGTPDEAAFQHQRFEQTGRISRVYGSIDCWPDPGHLVVDQACSDASRARLACFVRWILQAFAPCEIYDQDLRCDITAQVQADPDCLFT
jgi:hypothetical protein